MIIILPNEQQKFSARLVQALEAAGIRPKQTDVWRVFNQRHAGPPVTIHAVRKWLTGESIPAQDKLQTLADWLSVNPNWLRFGESSMADDIDALRPEERRYVANLRCLSDEERQRLTALAQVMAQFAKKRES
ncbi:MAG: hypothetical protein FJY48_07460 [Betaproteobacteria bacterium]|nr:hypothetical protein [Betaproteobacteria bacterium]